MFLRRLTLDNVKSIEHLEIDFENPGNGTRRWTILLGHNGSGKSTLLKAIAVLMAGSDGLPELLVNPTAWVRTGTDECRMHADLVTAEGEARSVELVLQRGDNFQNVFERNREALSQLDAALSHTPRHYFTVGYGATRRSSRANLGTTDQTAGFRHERTQNVATLFSPDAVLFALESWAFDAHYRLGNRGLDLVSSALKDLIPGVEFDSIDRERRQLMFRTADGLLPLSAVGDAYEGLTAWVGDLLYRVSNSFSSYKNPLTARGLLLIDEIDLHLHPTLQRLVVDYMNSKLPNFQIVATTYSPLTAQQAGEGELYTFERSEGGGTTCVQFQGNPSTLTLQQLVVSPIFGLSSIYSRPVEKMHDEYAELTSKPEDQMSRKDHRRLQQVRRELADLPDQTRVTPLQQQQEDVLKKIEQALSTDR